MSIKTVSVSLHNRPQYTRKVLSNLNNCYDIDNYSIFICCEPTNLDVIKLASQFRPEQTKVILNQTKLGCNKNIYQCLSIGFSLNDYHIHLEDDTVPAKDYLLYCEWARNKYQNDKTIFSVSGYSKSESNDSAKIEKRNWFTPWGWATWIDRWIEIELSFRTNIKNNMSWDCVTHGLINNRYEIFPSIARVQNIGAENGTFVPSAEWHKKHQYNEIWIETNQDYQTNFYE